ncbi:hypothetical protein FB45DRAFT_60426, partial [Roridomyces roridus]
MYSSRRSPIDSSLLTSGASRELGSCRAGCRYPRVQFCSVHRVHPVASDHLFPSNIACLQSATTPRLTLFTSTTIHPFINLPLIQNFPSCLYTAGRPTLPFHQLSTPSLYSTPLLPYLGGLGGTGASRGPPLRTRTTISAPTPSKPPTSTSPTSTTPIFTAATQSAIINIPNPTPSTPSATNNTPKSPPTISTSAVVSPSTANASTHSKSDTASASSAIASSSPVPQVVPSTPQPSSLGPSASTTNVAVLSAPGTALHSAAITGIAASLTSFTVCVLILVIWLKCRRRRSRRISSRMTMNATPFHVSARPPSDASTEARANTPAQGAEIVAILQQPSFQSRNNKIGNVITQNAAESYTSPPAAATPVTASPARTDENSAPDADLAVRVMELTARVHELEAERRISPDFLLGVNADPELEAPPE